MPALARGTLAWVLTPALLGILLILAPLPNTTGIGAALLVLALLLTVFFRDPDRTVGEGVVSPADGRIQFVDEGADGRLHVAVFMNLHNVHVNRAPLPGTVETVEHVPGAKRPAFTKESEHNERVHLHLLTDHGPVEVVQIAGTVARRIVPYVAEGETVKKGERIGIIRLGSRVDLHLPSGFTSQVDEGDRVRAGETPLALRTTP